jgi:hypothetical protein
MNPLIHSSLGAIKGVAPNGYTQYLGVKYASSMIALAMALHSMLLSLGEEHALVIIISIEGDTDTQQYRPGAPSTPLGCEREFSIIQHDISPILTVSM